MNQLSKLQKQLALTNDQGLNVSLSVLVLTTIVVVSTYVWRLKLLPWGLPGGNQKYFPNFDTEMGQPTDLSTRGPSPSPAMKGHSVGLSTPVEGGSPKHALLKEGCE